MSHGITYFHSSEAMQRLESKYGFRFEQMTLDQKLASLNATVFAWLNHRNGQIKVIDEGITDLLPSTMDDVLEDATLAECHAIVQCLAQNLFGE